MNTISRILAGISSVILGLWISYDNFVDKPEDWLWAVGVGIFFIVIGLFIFFNKKEDEIEEIKNNEK